MLLYGFADTIGSVALLVAFGVMLGRLLEVTGGAQVLADTLIGRFGEKRAPFALGVAALLFGFPIFFDAGLVVFLPIILTVARRFGGSLLLYALPAAGRVRRHARHRAAPPGPGRRRRADRRRHRPDAADRRPDRRAGVVRRRLPGLQFLGARIDVAWPTSSSARSTRTSDGEDDDRRSGAGRPPSATVLGLLLHPAGPDLLRHRRSTPWSPPAPWRRGRLGRLPGPPRPDADRAADHGAGRDLRARAGRTRRWPGSRRSSTRRSARSARSS